MPTSFHSKMSCNLLDKDQSFMVHDYGPDGYVGTANIILQHGLKPGGIVSVVTNTSEPMEINLRDVASNTLLHVVNRASKNEFALNSHMDNKWGVEEKVTPIPVQKGVRTVTTMLYQDDGFRVFINGKDIGFYKHRSNNAVHLLHITTCQIFKIAYLTVKNIIP